MPMNLTSQHLQRLAGLTQLGLTSAEEAQLLTQIDAALSLSESLADLATQAVEPLVYPFDVKQTPRADEVTEVDTSEQAFKLAPAVEDKHFLVPQVVE